MLFLTFTNASILFLEREITVRFWTIAKVLSAIKQVEIIDKK